MKKILLFSKRLGIWQQLLICLSVVSIFFSFSFGYVLRQVEHGFLLSKIEETNQRTVSLITATSLDAILTEDRPVLESIIVGVAKADKAIIAIRISNENGQPLAEWRNTTSTDKNPIVISEKIVTGDEVYGSLILEWDSQSVEQQAQSHAVKISYLYALSLIVVSLTMLGALSIMIVRPLVKIRSHIGHIGSGNVTDILVLDSNREVKALSESLNMLSSILQKQKDDESRHRQMLEKEVEERTRELQELYDKVHYQSLHDNLTGLANRQLYFDRIALAIERAKRRQEKLVVFFIDTDNFKSINDTYGHDIGDKYLIAIGERLAHALRKEDTIARLGGDEFAILFTDIKSAVIAGRIAEKILRQCQSGVTINSMTLPINLSIGISVYPDDGADAADLVKSADIAMYHVKKTTKNNYRFYSADINKLNNQRNETEEQLRNAVINGDITVFYQPKISLATGNIVGVEALIRWIHPEQGIISPGEFLPIAEQCGIIGDLDMLVLEKAVADVAAWHNSGFPDLNLSVNFSAQQFLRKDLIQPVKNVVSAAKFDPSKLEIEITENVIVSNTSVVKENLNALKNYGVQISLDDFGSGHASFSYLKNFPIDIIKLDRSIVIDIDGTERGEVLVKTMIDMGHAFNMIVVAEGVETNRQIETLQNIACDVVQGFLFSVPLDKADMDKVLRGNKFATLIPKATTIPA